MNDMPQYTKKGTGHYHFWYNGKLISVYRCQERTVHGGIARWWEARFVGEKELGLGAGSRKQAAQMAQNILDRRKKENP